MAQLSNIVSIIVADVICSQMLKEAAFALVLGDTSTAAVTFEFSPKELYNFGRRRSTAFSNRQHALQEIIDTIKRHLVEKTGGFVEERPQHSLRKTPHIGRLIETIALL